MGRASCSCYSLVLALRTVSCAGDAAGISHRLRADDANSVDVARRLYQWGNPAMGQIYDDSGSSDSDDVGSVGDFGDSSHLQTILGFGLGGAILVITICFTWRAWMQCCTSARQPPKHRAFLRQSTTGWKCRVCLHTNDGLQLHCVLCGSPNEEPPEPPVSSLRQYESIDAEQSASNFVLLVSPTSASSRPQTVEQLPVEVPQLDDRQQVAVDRHAWKRCIGRQNVRWIRVELDEMRQNPALQGTLVLHKDVFSPARSMPRQYSGRVSGSASLLSVESSFARSDSSRMGLFVLTRSTGFVRDQERGGEAVWKFAEEVAESTRKHTKEMQRVAGLTFSEKAAWLYQHSLKISSSIVDGFYMLRVRREHVLQDSIAMLAKSSTAVMRRRLRVDFQDEPGVDGGGILREWLQLMCQEMFAESQGLFAPTNSSQHHGYWIKRSSSGPDPQRLQLFNFFGRVLGKAVLEGLILSVRLCIPLLKHILCAPLGLSDLRLIDETVHTSLVWILEHDNTNALSLNFTVEGHELIPNGRDVALHDGNKHLYVAKVLQYYLCDSVDSELKSLLRGLRSVLDDSVLHVFDYKELDLVISGLPTIDVADWRKHSDVRYLGDNPEQEARVVEWFWDVVESFTQEQRSRLLQFVTGSSGVPVEGFKGLTGMDGDLQRFTIHLSKTRSYLYSGLPHASTCLNRLDLPVYSTREEIEEILQMVIQMDVTGFSSR